MARRINRSHPDNLVPLRAAASVCGCEDDPGLIPDLIRMRLIDPVIVRLDGRRYLAIRDLDYVAAWVAWWNDRPRRPVRSIGRRRQQDALQ